MRRLRCGGSQRFSPFHGQVAHGGHEDLGAVGVVAEHVQAGAGRAQQHGVALVRLLEAPGHRRLKAVQPLHRHTGGGQRGLDDPGEGFTRPVGLTWLSLAAFLLPGAWMSDSFGTACFVLAVFLMALGFWVGYWAQLASYARRPHLLWRSVETVLYPWLAGGHGAKAEQPSAELLSIMVEPGQQSQGIGTHLLHTLFAECRARGIPRLTVTVDAANTRAQRFYQRHGFQPGERFLLYGRPMCGYQVETA